MASYCWKVKALKSNGPIAQGMEIEVIIKNTNRAPSGNEIRDAFSAKYSIKAPTGIYGSKHLFEIIKP